MSTKNEVLDLRKALLSYIRSSFIGPDDEREVLEGGKRPHNIYLAGALFSSDKPPVSKQSSAPTIEDTELAHEYNDLTEQKRESLSDVSDDIPKDAIMLPSSAGITFYVSERVEKVKSVTSFGTYILSGGDTVLTRNPHSFPIELDLTKSSVVPLIPDWVELDVRVRFLEGAKIVTVTLINRARYQKFSEILKKKRSLFKDISTLWQCQIKIIPSKAADLIAINHLKTTTLDSEIRSQVLLYRAVPIWAVGHNCSAKWNDVDGNLTLATEFMPDYELYLMKPASIEGVDLNVTNFVDEGKFASTGLPALKKLVASYNQWIKDLSSVEVPPHLEDIAKQHINDCSIAVNRMNSGISVLEKNPIARKSFISANRILELQNHWKKTFKFSWHPFQIGFALLNLVGICDSKSADRKTADLLWFPTGGGKTEAYLLISAFLLVYRNIANEGAEKAGAGTAIILRYTLRLLTQQQLQRATRMICAAEHLRVSDAGAFGKNSFSIGLWVGDDSFPNENKSWEKRRDENKAPLIFESCPCCSEALTIKNYSVNSLDKNRKKPRFTRLEIKCSNSTCHYFNIPLPVHLTDEDVFKFSPSIIVGTVDKFAQVAWSSEAGKIFNIFSRHCKVHGYFNNSESGCDCQDLRDFKAKPPELIIQDELHLITGPLGSMVGSYELAVRKLCERDGERPKYIASTATIRGANRQLMELYGSDSFQFPPPGVDHDDSFFAKQGSAKENDYGRLYVGISAKGKSGKLVMARIYGLLNHFYQHHLGENVISREAMDYLRTVIGYFNSRKELGGVLSMMGDDVLKWRKFHHDFDSSVYADDRPLDYAELKGGMSGDKVTKILNTMEMKNHVAPEFVLATNILSVGIDINRLFGMVVAGQPKTTSEYIQASSRVGRAVPGLVITNFNWARSRDVSHYEKFISYHSQMYRYVEGISVTPLSPDVRARTMAGILVTLVRHLIPEMNADESAKYFQAHKTKIQTIVKDLCDSIDSLEHKADFTAELKDFVNRWDSATAMQSAELKYRASNSCRGVLKAFGSQDMNFDFLGQFVTSLRNVDEEVPLTLKGKL